MYATDVPPAPACELQRGPAVQVAFGVQQVDALVRLDVEHLDDPAH